MALSDKENPKKWSYTYKWTVTGIVGSAGFVVAWASAVDSEVAPQIVEQFGVGQEVSLLGTTLFMVTFGLGSLISAPFSEVVGRNPVYIISLIIFGLFTMGAGLATDIESYLVCRSFAGLFGCPPLTNFGGTTADLWTPTERTYVFPVLACLSFLGPFLAPMVADFVGPSPLVSWQWTEWLTLIFTGALVAGILFFAPETYAPVIQSWKASQLRKISGDDQYMTDKERHSPPFGTRLLRSIYIPIKFLFTEPITDLFALYLIILYIILFGFLPGFQFIFGEEGIYGFGQNHTGLCFIPMNVGFLLALIPIFPIYRRFKRKMQQEEERGKDKVVPEERLLHAMIAGPCLPISLFWLGWTSWLSVSFWSPLIASVRFGFSVMGIFISCYQYIIDTYETMAASALVGMTLLRYCASGPMVIVSLPMYTNLGVHWTLTLLGCLSAVMAPVPFFFYFGVGAWARKKSKNATSFE
ncbi:hypothetical protein M409DRAFT_35102 [Zasmidium cellare ATCC 36951]|uniref:Major facilitator superfamily (MFS) profile domain-containing protein n=1 Tax=Zasmidium cellare ATCC 36951 TaxID=1080233 RepID=A0A6A6D7R4_ZASCE|nr:uncharacterized protein M409DRAFT_35102 [Zasmidium cellare ATCC 36951]KAF2174282.1 hypothetical protein M409DRAFT_35102 [Zasmidium cellare ATCC 36951]